MNTKAPNCWQCRFFAVSWDPSKPYACQLMGFKTKVLPSIEVLRADGQRCRGFSAKAVQLVDRAGKSMRAEQLQAAMQQVSLCLKTSYQDCPE